MENSPKADLHIHTCYSSDGERTPAWIADRCRDKGIGVFTISDHNTVRGARETARLDIGTDMKFIPGIEIDCMARDTHMHLLGFNIDTASPDFDRLEQNVDRIARDEFRGMFDNMVRLGFPVDMEDILAAAGDKIPTGELILETMLTEKNHGCELLGPYFPGGNRADMPMFNFWFDWFAQGCPAYVPVEYMPFTDAVAVIRDNGGVPVIAHPGQNFRGREEETAELLDNGAAGLECFNNYHTPEQQEFFASLAVKKGALTTAGSDFHGKIKPRIDLGQYPSPGEYAGYLADSVGRLAGN